MGDQDIKDLQDAAELRVFVQHLLRDLQALEQMLAAGIFETSPIRIGAEQELFVVDERLRPSPLGPEVLEACRGVSATPELARFNLEFNLDPVVLGGDCLSQLEAQLNHGMVQVRQAAHQKGVDVAMFGILPTLMKSDLTLENMWPSPRYRRMNEILTKLRGGDYELRIKGVDEISVKHDSVMLEACNTSYQIHLQVDPAEFAWLYNIAQAITAPVLAAAVNSPLLWGRQLWRETRIALFQQSLDTRLVARHEREMDPRVGFGNSWVKSSVLDIYREDIARFRVIFGKAVEENPFDAIRAGVAPRLEALRLHNGTIYRWNRPCYGITDGRPHLRIEARMLPAGPSIVDEVANSAFWFGLMRGCLIEYGDISQKMDFMDARSNLVSGARIGLGATMVWVGKEELPVRELILQRLLPIAYQGLSALGIHRGDAEKYLGIIEARVSSGRTGAQWQISSMAGMKDKGTRTERLAALAASTKQNQIEGKPVHTWELARLDDAGGWSKHYRRVEQFMTTDLFTVKADDVVDLVACLMDWRKIRHVPVEDHQQRLVGLVGHRSLLRLIARGWQLGKGGPIPVSEIMQRNLVTVTPETSTVDAIRLMRNHHISCLPVVKDERLVGIISETDLVLMAAPLLEMALKD